MKFIDCLRLNKIKSLILFSYSFIFWLIILIQNYNVCTGGNSRNCGRSFIEITFSDYIFGGIFYETSKIFTEYLIESILITILFLFCTYLLNSIIQYLYYKYKEVNFTKYLKFKKWKSILLFIYFIIYMLLWINFFHNMYIRPEVTPEYIEINEISFIDYVFTGTFFKTASLFDRPVLFGGITILFMGILHVLNSVGECIYDLRFKKKK